jgi:alpha-ribazole phosphatase
VRWIWVRHGQTEENRTGRYLGHSDVPLNEHGCAQAEQAARMLASERPAALYTSDLLRCRQTAERLAAVWGLGPRAVPALRELSFGAWERLTYDELMARDGELARRWYDNPFDCAPPGGETLTQLGERVDRWLMQLMRSVSMDDTVCLVTHGGVIRWFQAAWVENDPRRYWQVDGVGHGGVLVAKWDGRRWTAARMEDNPSASGEKHVSMQSSL